MHHELPTSRYRGFVGSCEGGGSSSELADRLSVRGLGEGAGAREAILWALRQGLEDHLLQLGPNGLRGEETVRVAHGSLGRAASPSPAAPTQIIHEPGL